jgi:hypothetical protein
LRQQAAHAANAEDADLWRWFANLVDERRIRWCCADGSWLVSIDHRHVATETTFDNAIRSARRVAHDQRKRAAVVALPRRRVT